MIPINGAVTGVILALGSRAIRGEVRLSEKGRGRVIGAREKLDELTGMVGNLSPTRPQSWGRFAVRILDRVLDDEMRSLQHRYDSGEAWLRAEGYREFDPELPFVLREVRTRAEREVVFESEREVIFGASLPGGARVCWREEERRTLYEPIYFRPKIDGKEKLYEGIARLFWEGRREVMLDVVERDEVSVRPLQLAGEEYHGPLMGYLEGWQAFRRAEVRRNVLIQGPPGCGKSTFCAYAARQLSRRTIVLTSEFFQNIRCGGWCALLELLGPEAVIVDDIDRSSEHALESKLRLFEEGYCNVPFVFFTTNDHMRLPAPMRRPGRIDQIIEVTPPEQNVRRELIAEMARREGVDAVPDMYRKRLDGIMVRQSPAHLREALRRAKVMGWEAVFSESDGDRTFEGAFEGAQEVDEIEEVAA